MDLKNFFERAWLPLYFIPLVLFSLGVAVLDAQGYQMFQVLDQPAEVYTSIVDQYMVLFHGLAFLGVAGMGSVVYYYRGFRDALAFTVFTLSVVWSGLWDLLYYRLPGTPGVPETLTHLADTPVGTAAILFNSGVVTEGMVLLNAVLFIGLGLPLAGFIRYGDVSFFD